ncbi:MAG: hypothetical protein IJF11_05545 [Clostridia bacterium]|nr:hypothetical protein [Clostridia bacterium]
MDNYGEFTQSIFNLKDSVSELRAIWKDQTAPSYEAIHENFERFSFNTWQQNLVAVEMHELVKENYSESEFDQMLDKLSARLAEL